MSAFRNRGIRRPFGVMVVLILACVLWACGAIGQSGNTGEGVDTDDSSVEVETAEVSEAVDYGNPGDGYTLCEVVILARHNIRAPLSTGGSVLARATPNQWIEWTANPSCLTLRGGALETMLGQYVRQWLEAEGLVERDWQPDEGEVRFYANSLERTHATAQYFSSGFLPVADARVETHFALNEPDPVFIPYVTFLSDSYEEAALAQIAEMGGEEGMAGIASELADNYKLLADVCDYTQSEGYLSGDLSDFDTTDTQVTLEVGKEPSMTGTLRIATSLSDALVLQYYEADDEHAAFGKELTLEQWEQISAIKDRCIEVLFTAPLVATNVAHPLLQEIGSELDHPGRILSFLCGHDSDIACVLAALGAEDCELPNTIEKTPIGSMVVFERWEDADGALYGRVRLVYQTTDQLRNVTLLEGGERPESVELSLDGLEKNADGLYAYDDLRGSIQDSIDAYDEMVDMYTDDVELPEAA